MHLSQKGLTQKRLVAERSGLIFGTQGYLRMDYVRRFNVQDHFVAIQCAFLKMSGNPKTAGHRTKRLNEKMLASRQDRHDP